MSGSAALYRGWSLSLNAAIAAPARCFSSELWGSNSLLRMCAALLLPGCQIHHKIWLFFSFNTSLCDMYARLMRSV